jgi:chromosome segregation ATPase
MQTHVKDQIGSNNLRETIYSLRSELNDVNGAIENGQDILAQNQKQVRELELKYCELTDKVNKKQIEFSKFDYEMSVRERVLAERVAKHSRDVQDFLEQKTDSINILEEEISELIDEVNEISAIKRDRQSEIDTMEQDIARGKKVIENLANAIESYKRELNDVVKATAIAREKSESTIQLGNQCITEKRGELATVNKTIDEVKKSVETTIHNIAERELRCTEREQLVSMWARRVSGILKERFGSNIEL